VNGLDNEQISMSDMEDFELKSLHQVEIEDLCYPFTKDEFVKQTYPSFFQKWVTRPVAIRMIDKGETFVKALQAFGREKKNHFINVSPVISRLYSRKSWFFGIILGFFLVFLYTAITYNWDQLMQSKIVDSIQSVWADEVTGTLIEALGVPLFLAIWICVKYLFQIFLVLFIFNPSFQNLVMGAIRIKEHPSELKAQYAEKNLDVLLSPMRPAGMQTIILENYPNYGDQIRSAVQGVEFQAYIDRAQKRKSKFPHNLEEIFSNKACFEAATKHHSLQLTHFDWCLVGMWTYGEVIPNDGSDWEPKNDYKRFAEVTFAQCIHSYASESGITPSRLEDFYEDYPDLDCFYDYDKRKKFIADTFSEKHEHIFPVLEKLKEQAGHSE
jgi:hypothetical protein